MPIEVALQMILIGALGMGGMTLVSRLVARYYERKNR
jgi:hypothetical protein